MTANRRRILRLAGATAASCAAACSPLRGPDAPRLVEEQTRVRVHVRDPAGAPVEHDIVVTVFLDAAWHGPYPIAVLGHGRAFDPARNAAIGRARYSAAAGWLTGFGFLVAVPTRVGYGASGGPDVENTGTCSNKAYPPGYQAAALQTLAVLAAMRRRPDTTKTRALVLGQSFGGTAAITVAAMAPAGVHAAINFAGGGGGNPDTRPEHPCAPEGLRALFAGYGRTVRLPTLWVYSRNDRYWGPSLPREWFDAFRSAGGTGEFLAMPDVGDDGHSLFTAAPQTWQPPVANFLRRLGYGRPRDATTGAR